jgi:hypothetical protein
MFGDERVLEHRGGRRGRRVISAAISYYFARKASKELRKEAGGLLRETEDVRHYVNALISYLEAAGTIEVVRRPSGPSHRDTDHQSLCCHERDRRHICHAHGRAS